MISKTYISWEEVKNRLKPIDLKRNAVYGIPKGGMIAAGFLRFASRSTSPENANIILDDLVDSGATRAKYVKEYPDKKFFCLFNKQLEKDLNWIVFPWEKDHPQGEDTIEQNIRK